MLKDLGNQIDQGKSDDEILTYFAEKYGTGVLSAPPTSGFNLAAWVMPFVALAIGAVVAVYCVRRFRARWTPATPGDVDVTRYQDKVEEELKKYTPED